MQDASGKAADRAVGWAIATGAPFAFGEQSSHLLLTSHVALMSLPASSAYKSSSPDMFYKSACYLQEAMLV